MKNGLLLTLKQLIKLGVINLKKKKRRRAYQKTLKSPFTKGDSINPIDIQGMGQQRYKAFVSTSAPNPQAYSDALRLRDESNNFNTRLLEYKNQQQDQKLLLEDQQQQQQQLQQRQLQIQRQQQLQQQTITEAVPIVNNLLARTKRIELGFADDDNVDVTETFGSENFKTQQDIADPPPPQIPQAPTSQEMYEDITESLTKSLTPPLALPPPKRGRGRPRKNK